ncbi:MAG: HAMP domain-containing histidine kinase, partial [Chloroflexi bacterium]|nr:HAMP domain-containing histidine kinase [Chloroflexota bacterium]
DTDLQELQKDTFVVVLVLVIVLALILFYVMLLAQSFAVPAAQADYRFWWLPSTLACLVCYFSFRLYKANHFRPATYVFVGGLTLTVLSFTLWSNSSFNYLQVYLLLLIVAMAGLLISPQAAAQTAVFVVLVTLSAAFYFYGFSWQTVRPLVAPLSMACGMAVVSWVSSEHLTTAMGWALHSQERAHQRTQELFESQQELKKAYHLLETTNVRLKAAEAAAVETNRLKTRFITNLSHELRTPLNAIINFSYILSKNHHGAVTPEQADYLTRIHNSGELLLQIVNDLLDLAKIEAGQMDLFKEQIDLAAMSENVLSTVSGLLTDKPVELRREISPTLPRVVGDETRLRQVLLNLLGNAAKYTDQGSITLRAARNGSDFVKVSVIDTGIGIRAEDFERIFEEFQQTEEAFALRKVGTGLGLPISKKFIELHGGKLWVESELGHGSAFHFTVPITAGSSAESDLTPAADETLMGSKVTI